MITDRVGVLIAGGGPVGLTLAMELGWRGVDCVVVEQNPGDPTSPRCNTTAARSMEHFRRLGCAEAIRAAGLPSDYPTDVTYSTRLLEHELVRFELPSRGSVQAMSGTGTELDGWPTPEPQHRIAQRFLEPILAAHAETFSSVQIFRGQLLASFRQDSDGVTCQLKEAATGRRRTVTADYLVGADGSHSTVRRALGITFQGIAEITRHVSYYFRSQQLTGLLDPPAWMAFAFNPDGIGNVIAIDGKELWLNHTIFPLDADTRGADPARLLAQTVGREVDHEPIDVVHWTSRSLVADSYRHGRVMLCGDAAHIWVPMAGFGMNSGVQDAVDLGWKLAATIAGWAGAGLLDSYETERRSVGQQVAAAAAGIANNLFYVEGRAHVEDQGQQGERARRELAAAIREADQSQFNPVGLNFGYHYESSPLIVDDGSPSIPMQIGHYLPDAKPGHRLPHVWLDDGASLFDRLGREFTLVTTRRSARVEPIVEAASRRHVPLQVLTAAELAEYAGAAMVLVRPDQHVAWRGDNAPDDPIKLIDTVRGERP